jgi:hypothetical protein
MSTSTKQDILEWIASLMAALLGAVEPPPPVQLPPELPPITRVEPVPERPAGISCRIVRHREGELDLLIATATSVARIDDGSFMMVVRSDGMNRSVSRQQGTFEAAAGETVRLATVQLRGADRARTKVSLDLTVASASVPCSFE